MKKLILLFTFISLASCSHDADVHDYKEEKNYQGPRYMDPPAWIQGTWMDDKQRAFKFTQDDLLYKYPMQNFISTSDEIYDYESKYWKEYEQYQNPNVQEVELIDYYSLKYNCYGAPSKKFMFTRISENQIESTGFMPGIYTKQ
ncbi:hypothetical protein OD917_07135 [Flavobacterium sp. SH_e]|uniref:hypothetical protein n=1 Tax=Flavobacterium TaxID=237 RepID=UPI0021E4C3CF|nr:hypothetical protein [Flavobacterium sp. SH_e]MCV2484692.1 hypothetical protein [Flavobacterium sp. SH_e]